MKEAQPNDSVRIDSAGTPMLSRRSLMRGMAFGLGGLAMTSLAACAPAAAPAAEESMDEEAAPAPMQETVIMWYDLGASDAQVWERLCENYNEANEHPDITFEYEQVGGGEMGTKIHGLYRHRQSA